MSAEYSVNSLQHLILSQHASTSVEAIAALRAFQERIKADDGAVPVAYVPIHPTKGPLWMDSYPYGSAADRSPNYEQMPLFTHPASRDVPVAYLAYGEGALESWQPTYIVGSDEDMCHEAVKDSCVGWNPYKIFPVFTHPPAQAAQVDAAKSMKACPEHQVEMLMARAVASGVVIPDAPPACPLSLSDIVKLIVNSYPVAAIVREMDAQAPGIRGAFAPLAPIAAPAAQSEAATVRETSAGPRLLVHGVECASWLGTAHNERAYRIAEEINIAAQPRAVPDGWVLVHTKMSAAEETAMVNVWNNGPHAVRDAMLAAAPSPGESS